MLLKYPSVGAKPLLFVHVWSSAQNKATFVSSLNMLMGLLGRDVMAEWKEVAFAATPARKASKWDITIRI